MTLNNSEPAMGKNFWLAMILSLVVILGYPAFVRWMSPPTDPAIQKEEETADTQPAKTREAVEEKLAEWAGPVLENLAPPSTAEQENQFFSLTYSTLGGTVSRLWFKGEAELPANTETLFYQTEPTVPGLFALKFLHDKENLAQKVFTLTPAPAKNTMQFVYEKPGEYRIYKIYRLEDRTPVIHFSVRLENLSGIERHFPMEITYGLSIDTAQEHFQQHHKVVAWTGKVEAKDLGHVAKKGYELSAAIQWAGLLKKYYALLVKPEIKILALQAEENEDILKQAITLEPVSVAPGAAQEIRFLIYAGPERYETLQSFDSDFENLLSQGFFGVFKIWLLRSLKFLNQFTHNYGWAIILLTLLVKGLFAPLTHISYKSMKKMQAIQPKLKAIQERHKNNPEKINKETMELFRRNKVNPMAGCLPMLLQMPVFFAMFRLLQEAIELKGAPFIFWIQDLSQPDRLFHLPFAVPFLGWDAFNLLPILMILSQFWYQKIMPQTSTSPEQAKIMGFMPVFFGFICYNLASGLVLYWFIQNLLSIIQQVFVNRIVIQLHHEDQH